MAQVSTAARIAENIRRVMYVKRINQGALAAVIGRSQSAMSRKLLGQSPLSIHELERIADALDVPLSDLIAESEPNAAAVAWPR